VEYVISAQLAAPNRTAICLFEWSKWAKHINTGSTNEESLGRGYSICLLNNGSM